MSDLDPSSCPITPLPEFIGPYKVLQKIASGGMGEVFLIKDPQCKRSLALKKIRSDKATQEGLRARFIKEVQITARLSHPSIIPIYQIHEEDGEIYYTMPVVIGETLKDILKQERAHEKEGKAAHPIGSSIPSLMRIFLSVCQAIAYAHSKGVLHRDLKPDNIIVGSYGEVLVLDWGLANFIDDSDSEEVEPEDKTHFSLTKPGKIAGTLSYLPPERIFGGKSSYTCDVYALGVILYQLLTLRPPFHRKTIKQYKKQVRLETLIDPCERAPYRDIPSQLSNIAKKCLARKAENRYQSVEEILTDLNKYIEGHPEWVPFTSIQVEKKGDWEFQENILLTKHLALTEHSDIMEWVSLMVAKESFSGKIKLETHVHIKEDGKGIGFLLSHARADNLTEFCHTSFLIWVGSDKYPGCSLFKSNVELMSNPEVSLKKGLFHSIRIEKTDYHVKLYIDNHLAFDYLSHTPHGMQKAGIILRDDELEIGAILVSTSSPHIQINCLAVPDTLLSLGQFKEALTRYRQIANSFSGRGEGKEALFRAGITLIEEAKSIENKEKQQVLFDRALQEFDLFRKGSGSPLEYLGKSLVYHSLNDHEEELKCLELALRRFPRHPQTHLVKEQVLFRLHEASYKDKKTAYALTLLAVRLLPEAFEKEDHQRLLEHLYRNSEELRFLPKEQQYQNLPLYLAFFLVKPATLVEIFTESSVAGKVSAVYCLLYLGEKETAKSLLCDPSLKDSPLAQDFSLLHEKGFASHPLREKLTHSQEEKRFLDYCFSQFLYLKQEEQEAMVETLHQVGLEDLSYEERLIFEKRRIECLILGEKIKEAKELMEKIPALLKEQEGSFFYFLDACLLGSTEGEEKAKIQLSRGLDHPPKSPYLIDYYLHAPFQARESWLKKAFFWEKVQLFEQLITFYTATENETLKKRSAKELEKLWHERISV